jgi:hypothetical protein
MAIGGINLINKKLNIDSVVSNVSTQNISEQDKPNSAPQISNNSGVELENPGILKNVVSDLYGDSYLENPYAIDDVPIDPLTNVATWGTHSLANRHSTFTWIGMYGNPNSKLTKYYTQQETNLLVRPPISEKPTYSNIINFFKDNYPGIDYQWSDFLFCKYYNQIPNNYLLTLRRYSMPPEDNIYKVIKNIKGSEEKDKFVNETNGKGEKVTVKKGKISKTEPASFNLTQPDMARACTYLSEKAGNKLEDILKFSYNYNWRDVQAEVKDIDMSRASGGGYESHNFFSSGLLGSSVGKSIIDVFRGRNFGNHAATEWANENRSAMDDWDAHYPHKIYGPINVISKRRARERGLSFEHDINLVFEYEIKAYDGLNTKMAFLDIMANIMVLTYGNAQWWGGANRFVGHQAHVGPRYGDNSKLMQGDAFGFARSVMDDVVSDFQRVFAGPGGTLTLSSFLEGLLKGSLGVLNNVLGRSFIDSFGTGMGSYVAVPQLLTGEAVGDWHLTVGNPLNPIAMIGNLCLENSTIEFFGPLSHDDFPTNIKLTCQLKHGRPRDKSDFESMFNAGRGRLYGNALSLKDKKNISATKDTVQYTNNSSNDKYKSKGEQDIVTKKYAHLRDGFIDHIQKFIHDTKVTIREKT